MRTAWRIVKRRHAESAFNGEGARQFGGRWNSPGTAVVYVSDTRALALLEVLVGIRSTQPIGSYVVIPVEFDVSFVHNIEVDQLPDDWRVSPPSSTTQRIGDEWATQARSAILRVPSVIITDEFNYILNPLHPDFMQVRIGNLQELRIDPRLLK